jgi:hypothetical protein
MLVSAFLLHRQRPQGELQQPSASLVRATGKCAECHRRETSAVIHEFEMSRHAQRDVNCLDCHQPVEGQESLPHRGFVIARHLTAANCRTCHSTQYRQFERSRHAAPAWAAVSGPDDFTAEQVAFAESFHPGAVERPANALAQIEGPAAIHGGCNQCHAIGRPNSDGSIGTCTSCHARHASSVELARTPETCGQCHMGPDHSQLEIYHESKHGVLFHAQRSRFHLEADPKHLTTDDMPVPTCATCHMSGLEGMNFTHDTTERLSMFLFAAKTEKRPNYQQAVVRMQEICLKCHTTPNIEKFYQDAEAVVASTNELVAESESIMKELSEAHLLTPAPFDEPIESLAFDLWHFYGRTAKHGAYMGGADFVQWHGFYELTAKLVEIRRLAEELRAQAADKQ